MMKWNTNIIGLISVLESISITDSSNKEVDPDAAFYQWQMHILQIRENKGTVYLIGNGASASMASYIPAQTYGYAETGHAAILHFWADMVVENTEDNL